MLLDKRIADRDDCAIEAQIVITSIGIALPCLVSDISEHGARLVVPSGVSAPTRFELLLPVTDDIIDRRMVELKWQHDRAIGVRFERS